MHEPIYVKCSNIYLLRILVLSGYTIHKVIQYNLHKYSELCYNIHVIYCIG